ncbi:hypothetical protein DIRU0_B02916 [Diutina rugosa]
MSRSVLGVRGRTRRGAVLPGNVQRDSHHMEDLDEFFAQAEASITSSSKSGRPRKRVRLPQPPSSPAGDAESTAPPPGPQATPPSLPIQKPIPKPAAVSSGHESTKSNNYDPAHFTTIARKINFDNDNDHDEYSKLSPIISSASLPIRGDENSPLRSPLPIERNDAPASNIGAKRLGSAVHIENLKFRGRANPPQGGLFVRLDDDDDDDEILIYEPPPTQAPPPRKRTSSQTAPTLTSKPRSANNQQDSLRSMSGMGLETTLLPDAAPPTHGTGEIKLLSAPIYIPGEPQPIAYCASEGRKRQINDDVCLHSYWEHDNKSACGMMKISGIKPPRDSGEAYSYFVVLDGRVEVTVADVTFLVTPGCTFKVPSHTVYGLRSLEPSRVWYTQVRDDPR